MVLATWWSEDGQAPIRTLPGLKVECPVGSAELATIAQLAEPEIRRRRADGHRPYLARVDGALAAYGWVATRSCSIGELGLEFELPVGNRYLWDFQTLPEFRGRGIYPRLLVDIIRRECPPATRLWIIHAPENLPSGAGIARAGFLPVAELSFGEDGRPALAVVGNADRAEAGAKLLGLPFAAQTLDPCWACGGCACDHSESGPHLCSCAVDPCG